MKRDSKYEFEGELEKRQLGSVVLNETRSKKKKVFDEELKKR